MQAVKFLSLFLISCACSALHAEVLVYRSVETTTLTGDGKRLPLSIKGTLVLDWNQGPASISYIGKFTFKGQRFYFRDSLEVPGNSFDHRTVVRRRLLNRPEQTYTFLKLNFSRFGWIFQDLAKGSTRPLTIRAATPSTPSMQVEFANSFRGGARDLFTDPQEIWFSLEGKSTFVFMSNTTQLANQEQLDSAAYVQRTETELQSLGYKPLTGLNDLLSLVP
jgi:hypothetical protein